VATRLAAAKGELAAAAELTWDAYIVNDNLDAAFTALEAALAPSRERANAARAAAAAAAAAAKCGGASAP
jgi:guanylate kinase